MRSWRPLLSLLLPGIVLSDVYFTHPAAGEDASTTLEISWIESGNGPGIDSFESYTLELMVGGNDEQTSASMFMLIQDGTFNTNDVTVAIASSVAGNTPNGFFLRMNSTIRGGGGYVVDYSDHFNIPDMTGTIPPQCQQGIDDLHGATAGPQNSYHLNQPSATPSPSSVSSASGSSVSTSGETVTVTATHTALHSHPLLSKGAQAGIGVAIGLLSIVTIGLAAGIVVHRRRRKQKQSGLESSESKLDLSKDLPELPNDAYIHEANGKSHVLEMESRSVHRFELDSGCQGHEAWSPR